MKKPVKTYEAMYDKKDTTESNTDVVKLLQKFYMCEYIDYFHQA